MKDTIRISGIAPESIVDGPGIRFTLFTQGCEKRCPGCHNPGTHDKNGGYLMTVGEILAEIKKNPLIDGVTFSGGEPFLQAAALAVLGREIKNLGLNLIVYSGYTHAELEAMPEAKELLDIADILIDGEFVEREKSLELRFRGSKNQQVINLTGAIIL
jgi:anaerobic ribonucleoside-triphosphate reductase activating protein